MNLKKIKDSNKPVRRVITNALSGMGFIVDYVDKVDSTHWSAKVTNLTEIMPFVTNNSNKVIDKACDWLKQNLGVGDAYDVELIDAEGNGYIEIFIDYESEEIKDSKISVSELRKRGFSHSGVDYLSGLNWFTVYGSKESVQKAVRDLKESYKGKISVKPGHLRKSNGQFEQEVRIKQSKIQDNMNLKKIKDAAKPAWVREFEKMSKGMPYHSEYDPEYDQITVKVSGFVDYIEPTANKWMKKAYEADSEEEMLNDDRWNPSWDVAEEALEYVCKKLGLKGYNEEVGAAPEMDMFWISNPRKIQDAYSEEFDTNFNSYNEGNSWVVFGGDATAVRQLIESEGFDAWPPEEDGDPSTEWGVYGIYEENENAPEKDCFDFGEMELTEDNWNRLKDRVHEAAENSLEGITDANTPKSTNGKRYVWVSLVDDLGDLLLQVSANATEEKVISELESKVSTDGDRDWYVSGKGWKVISYNPEGDRWESEDMLPEGVNPDSLEEWTADL